MATGAVLKVHDAIIARLVAQCPACPRWYSEGAALPGAALPYGVLGGHNERDESFLMHGGSHMRVVLRWFSDDREDRVGITRGVGPVLQIWTEVYAALGGHKLSLSGHQALIGRVELIDTYRDPEGYRNGVAHYTARTVTA